MKSKIALFLTSFIVLFFIFSPKGVLADAWYYPMDRLQERSSLKGFGQFIDQQFYVGKENLFPSKFYGYHTGIDLEIFPEESNENVSVFAISSGIISFAGHVSGYGGVILEKLDGENLTALYGHLKLKSINLKVGDRVNAGDQLSLLGDAFTSETDGERKHLHFGIYKDGGLYFKGYEQTRQQLETKWLDPVEFLKTRVFVSPSPEKITPTPSPTSEVEPAKKTSIFAFLLNLLRKIFGLN